MNIIFFILLAEIVLENSREQTGSRRFGIKGDKFKLQNITAITLHSGMFFKFSHFNTTYYYQSFEFSTISPRY